MNTENLGIAIVYVLCMALAAGFSGLVNTPDRTIHLMVIMPAMPEQPTGIKPQLINPIYRPEPDEIDRTKPCLIALSPGNTFRGLFFITLKDLTHLI